MDNKKDIQGQQRTQSYGNQGYPLNLQKGVLLVASKSPEDSFGNSISKKSERLATALYLVTSFLSDNEPLKFRLRALSLDLVQKSGSVRYGSTMSDRTLFEDTQRSISETLSLLELAFIAGIISEMNFTILKREYASLRDAIEVKKVSRESRTDTILGDTFFGSTFSEPQGQTLRNLGQRSDLNEPAFSPPKPTNSIGHPKGQTTTQMSDRNPASASRTQGSPLRNLGQRVTLNEPAPRTQLSTFNLELSTSVVRASRTTRILKLIKDNREVSIKDIATHFPELSEKTIQRELVSLTETNVLKKSGERRWSRYSLA